MSDIVERLNGIFRAENAALNLMGDAADEITRLRAEVERLNKSRNKWGQKYNKLLEKHKVTLSQLKTAVWSDSEECKFLTAEVERLRAALKPLACTCAAKHQAECSRSEVNCPFWNARAALRDTHE